MTTLPRVLAPALALLFVFAASADVARAQGRHARAQFPTAATAGAARPADRIAAAKAGAKRKHPGRVMRRVGGAVLIAGLLGGFGAAGKGVVDEVQASVAGNEAFSVAQGAAMQRRTMTPEETARYNAHRADERANRGESAKAFTLAAGLGGLGVFGGGIPLAAGVTKGAMASGSPLRRFGEDMAQNVLAAQRPGDLNGMAPGNGQPNGNDSNPGAGGYEHGSGGFTHNETNGR